jgi:hypothetical protein
MANEKRLIDANAIKYRTIGCGGWGQPEEVADKYDIDQMPTVDAVEVVHGYWTFEENPDGYYHAICSKCDTGHDKDAYLTRWNYCPNCGAKMDGGNEDG